MYICEQIGGIFLVPLSTPTLLSSPSSTNGESPFNRSPRVQKFFTPPLPPLPHSGPRKASLFLTTWRAEGIAHSSNIVRDVRLADNGQLLQTTDSCCRQQLFVAADDSQLPLFIPLLPDFPATYLEFFFFYCPNTIFNVGNVESEWTFSRSPYTRGKLTETSVSLLSRFSFFFLLKHCVIFF